VSTTPANAGTDRCAARRSTVPGLPEGLSIWERPPVHGWGRSPVVVLVHGSLDRGTSFNRVARRLGDLGLVLYDRRGYQGSRGPVADDLAVHAEDLVRLADAYAEHRAAGAGVVAVGHSVGATVVLAAAVSSPASFGAVGAYEPSMPWLGFHRRDAHGRHAHGAELDPALEAERFFRRMVGDAAWERLPEHEREQRRADGPALVADLRAIAKPEPFDVTRLSVPAVVSSGGPASFPHHVDTVDWLASHVPEVRRSTIPGAGHGAHLSHPDAFASLVRQVVELGSGDR